MSGPLSTRLFRQVSLERLASPDQLDQLVTVTSRRSWAALGAVFGILVAAASWSVIGRIPDTVAGTGILARSGGVLEVVPTTGGRVSDVAVDVGDKVIEGQVVARLERDDLAERLRQARLSLASMQTERSAITAFGRRDLEAQRAALAIQRRSLDESMTASAEQLRWLTQKIAAQEPLAQKGLITQSALANTRQQYEAAREGLGRTRTELSQLQIRQLDLDRRLHGERTTSESRIREQQLVVQDLERQLRIATEVISPASGRILEALVERGAVVGPGEPLLTLDLSGRAVQDLQAILFVPSEQGKRIRPGMTIRIAPATVKQEEYGLMLGRVTYVSDFPATSKGMRRILKNDALVASLSQGDAPYEVHAELIADLSTPSGFRWTSASGPPARIQSGTLAAARIEVAARRPLEMVIPLARRYAGL
jgi:HlyD family secretion protein